MSNFPGYAFERQVVTGVVGLFLISLGYGVINPIQSVFVADQFRPGQEQFMVNSFSWYFRSFAGLLAY